MTMLAVSPEEAHAVAAVLELNVVPGPEIVVLFTLTCVYAAATESADNAQTDAGIG